MQCVILTAFLPVSAAGQDEAQTMTNPPTLLKQYLTAPKPGQSLISGTAGIQLQSGLTETRGWSASATFAHTTAKHALAEVQVATNFASYRATNQNPFTTVENNQNALFTYMQPVARHFSWLGGAGWRRDAILQLSSRWWAEGGAGITLVNSKRAYLLVGGSFALGRERRSFVPDTDGVEDVGVLQILHWTPTSSTSIEEWVRSKHDVRHSDDHSTSFYLSFTAHVTKHAGLKIYYQLDDEGIVPPGSPSRQTTLAGGVQLTFTRAARSPQTR